MKKIVVGTDFGELATAALRFAANIAARTGAELVVVYADTFDPPAEFTSREVPDVAHSIDRSRRLANEELARYIIENVRGGIEWRGIVANDFPAAAINDVANAEQADLIALGTHSRTGLPLSVLGSVAEAVMRTAKVPVVTVRAADIAAAAELDFSDSCGPYT